MKHTATEVYEETTYFSKCQQKFPIISDDFASRLFGLVFILGNLLLNLNNRKTLLLSANVGRPGCLHTTHTCFLTANPAPLPKPANGFAFFPPGRKDNGRNETSSALIRRSRQSFQRSPNARSRRRHWASSSRGFPFGRVSILLQKFPKTCTAYTGSASTDACNDVTAA